MSRENKQSDEIFALRPAAHLIGKTSPEQIGGSSERQSTI
jgi:hypothetical protein